MFNFRNKKDFNKAKARRYSSDILTNLKANSFDTDNSLKLYEIPLQETKQYHSVDNDSDNVKSTTAKHEYSLSGYQRLHDEVETVITVHRENTETCITQTSDETLRFENNNKETKIKISLSQEQICNLVTTTISGGSSAKGSIKKRFKRNDSTDPITNISFTITNESDTKIIDKNSNLIKSDVGVDEATKKMNTRSDENHLELSTASERRYDSVLSIPIVQRKVSAPNDNITLSSDQFNKSNLFPHRSTSELANSDNNRFKKSACNNDVAATTNDDKLKCSICNDMFKDPRVLDCLHTFCLQCLINGDITANNESNQFWQKLNYNNSDYDWNWKNEQNQSFSGSVSGATSNNDSENAKVIKDEKRSSFGSFRLRKYSKIIKSDKLRDQHLKSERNSSTISFTDKPIQIICKICDTSTELPMGGFCRLPENFIISRLIQTKLTKIDADKKTVVGCSLCSSDALAMSHCFTCNFNLCNFCKEAHARQRVTAYHEVKLLAEIQSTEKSLLLEQKKEVKMATILCTIHPANELKLFCTTCQQVACDDCTILLHRDHKCETITKAAKVYLKLIRESLEKTRPLNDYAILTISKLNGISKKISTKCDIVQKDVEIYLNEYFEALEIHKKTLFNQIIRAKNNKMEAISCQQTDLEKRSIEAKAAIQFTDELLSEGTHLEILTFVNILLKRFEHCQKSKVSLDPKISESLQFLPEIKAPSAKAQNNIPMYGIITTQTAIPKLCTLETVGLMNLRVHRKAELQVVAKDIDERPLCHGGLSLHVELKYRDSSGRLIPTLISDKRDGSYVITFTPDSAGVMCLSVTIQGKPIKGSPFKLCARTLRPHCGIYHCCSFCSSGKSKMESCACDGVMPGGYKGCGHGHEGHPGRRHWSCCASVLENSECSKANTIVDVEH